ncbi:alpha/beta fold hydrolase [Streptomyces sp. NPDC056084]|uniref:alpha/beta fold hydrolase n=1 Tax=unclassified Streptomyces TaxID=2593676 RepID=UPI0035DDF1EB
MRCGGRGSAGSKRCTFSWSTGPGAKRGTNTLTEPAIGTLEVPGASLRYEVGGAGPVLLLIVGGGGGAGIFEPVADALADRFTVVTYDPRGHSRSPLDGPDVDQRVETQADDAYRLLERVAPDGPPAYVFGTSSGAIVAVELLTRHPRAAGESGRPRARAGLAAARRGRAAHLFQPGRIHLPPGRSGCRDGRDGCGVRRGARREAGPVRALAADARHAVAGAGELGVLPGPDPGAVQRARTGSGPTRRECGQVGARRGLGVVPAAAVPARGVAGRAVRGRSRGVPRGPRRCGDPPP